MCMRLSYGKYGKSCSTAIMYTQSGKNVKQLDNFGVEC